jgi:hypothetical protein
MSHAGETSGKVAIVLRKLLAVLERLVLGAVMSAVVHILDRRLRALQAGAAQQRQTGGGDSS